MIYAVEIKSDIMECLTRVAALVSGLTRATVYLQKNHQDPWVFSGQKRNQFPRSGEHILRCTSPSRHKPVVTLAGVTVNSLDLSCLPGDLGAVLNMALDTQSPFNLARIKNTQEERWWYPLRVCACSIRRYCGRTRSSWNHLTLPRPPRAILPTEPKDERHQAEERGPRQQLILRHP